MARRLRFTRALNKVAELGPGDSLGIGLCAMLSGTDSYYALDVKPHADLRRNLEVFEQLVELFQRKARIPDESEFPFIKPRLDSYDFPDAILTPTLLNESLRSSRLDTIRSTLKGSSDPTSTVHIRYAAPWSDATVIEPDSMDLIFSQAVLEHVEDLPGTYRALRKWVHPEGFMSHTVDFKCHGLTRDWNGHWTLGEFTWTLVKGTRPYLINRLPHSSHLTQLRDSGFSVVADTVVYNKPLARNLLSSPFAGFTDDDLRIEGAFMQSVPSPAFKE